ncbi:MAG: TonB-dependent receptor [Bacteroidota bacterium]|nr:TonB-dependent receptor [Bacteroidota bacterium]
MILGIMNIFALNTYSQSGKVSLNFKNTTVEEVLNSIEKGSEYYFAYNQKLINVNRKVDIVAKNKDIKDVLRELFKNTNTDYVVIDHQIVLSHKQITENELSDIQQQVKGVAITGTVVDSKTGETIPGVSVFIKGTTKGTLTDKQGKFNITTTDPKATLSFSFMGYERQDISVSGKTNLNVSLVSTVTNLEEVVVIGYGTVKRSNLTGAVASVKMDDIPIVATNSVSNLLTGRVPGLVIIQNSADPTSDYSILVRGATSTGAGNSPLYVIDGFTGGDINAVSPNDIASVEVLKDASATAIYGARAANGVILVSTKKGKKGKLEVGVQLNTSVQTISNPYNIVSAKEYMRLTNKFYVEEWMFQKKIAPYGNVDPSTVTTSPKVAFTDQEISSASNVTNWFDEISRTGTIDNQNISINGGSDQATYSLSLGHFKQKGVIFNSGYEKFMGRLAADFNLSKWLTTGVSITGNQQNSNMAEGNSGTEDPTGVIKMALAYPGYLPIRDANGNYLINPDHPTYPNPVSYKEVTNTEISNRFLITNYWSAKIRKDLTFRASMGLNQSFIRSNQYYPKTTLRGISVNSYASIVERRNNNYLLDATLTYKKSLFQNHSLTAMLGYAYQKIINENVSASNSDFLTDVYNVYNLSGGGNLTKGVGSGKSISKYLSYFGRVNYDIKDKYLFTFTLRADGSDRFGVNNRYGYFSSGAVAWRISQEDFMKSLESISNLKLRFSLGQTGNSEIGGNAYGYYSSGSNYVIGGNLQTGVSESQLPSPNLKWETTTEFNLGIDYGFFKNRLRGSVDVFRKTVSDLLDSRNVGSYYPVSSVADNLGSTLGQGWEFQLTSTNVQKTNFNWTTTLSLSHFYDRWKDRNPYTILSVYQTSTDPLHVGWGYVSDGLIQPGDDVSYMPGAVVGTIKLRDLNGWLKDETGKYILDKNGRQQLSGKPDHAIDDADKVIINHSQPKLTVSLNNTFQYKNFDLSFYFYGELGREKYNNTLKWFLMADRFRMRDNTLTDASNLWRHDNLNGKYPSGLDVKYDSSSDFWVEKADFIRLKSVTLGYTLPKSTGKFFQNARVYVDAQNLFVITNYTGSDPETDGFSAYPNQRTYSIGLNLNF